MLGRIISAQGKSMLVKIVLLSITLQLCKNIQVVEVRESFFVPRKIVIDREASPKLGHGLKVLHEGEILSRVFLRLLSNEQSEVKIVESKRIFVKSVHVGQETDMFNCFIGHDFVFFH